MRDTDCCASGTVTKKMTVRKKIDKLHELLTDALAIAARINGDEPGDAQVDEAADTILSVIEDDLSRALDKVSTVVGQLRCIEERL